MSTNFLTMFKRLTAKLAALSLVFSLLVPLAPTAFAATGQLKVDVSPATGHYNIRNTGGIVYANQIGDKTFVLNTGSYTVEFLPLAGYIAPANQTKYIGSGSQVTVAGDYTLSTPQGQLKVDVSPATGHYNIRNTGGIVYANQTGDKTFVLNTGSYTVEFLALTGYVTPANQTKYVASNSQVTVTGTYTQNNPQGQLTVTLSPSNASYNIRNAGGGVVYASQTGASKTFTLNAGSYTVEFLALSGYTTPAAVTKYIEGGGHETVNGVYSQVTGTGNIRIDVFKKVGTVYTPITNGSWALSGPSASNGSASTVISNAALGMYQIIGQLTPGYSSVMIESLNPQTLASGATITFRVVYSATAELPDWAFDEEKVTSPVSGTQKAGKAVDYEVKFHNNGASAPVMLTYTLDNRLTPGAATPLFGGFSCDPAVGKTIICEGTLPKAGEMKIKFNATIKTGTQDTTPTTLIKNSATVSGTGTDAVTTNNTNAGKEAAVAVVNPNPYLTGITVVRKGGTTALQENDTVTPGETLVYTVSYDNKKVAAEGTTFNLNTPHQTVVNNTCSGTTQVSGKGTCSYEATVDTAAADQDQITNTVVIATTDTDSDETGTSNTATSVKLVVSNPVPLLPDVTFSDTTLKSVTPATATLGDTVTVSFTVKNKGAAVQNVTVREMAAPEALTYQPGSVTGAVTCIKNPGDLACFTIDSIPANAEATVTYRATVASTLKADTNVVITSTASVQDEANTGDNTTAVDLAVKLVDLQITSATADKAVYKAGETVTYTVKYKNAGTFTATPVTATLNFDNKFDLTDFITNNQGWIKDSQNPLRFTKSLGIVESGGAETTLPSFTATLLDNVTSTQLGNAADDAKVTFSLNAQTETSAASGDNTATVGVDVQNVDLEIQKSVDQAAKGPNDQVTYTLKLRNNGPASATGVTVTDTITTGANLLVPSSFAFTQNPNNACQFQDTNADTFVDTILCNLGALNAGTATTDVTYTATVASLAAQGQTITNSAAISGAEFDDNGQNNTTPNVTVTIGNMPALAISKTVNGSEALNVPVGTNPTLNYSIVITNTGNANATGVTLFDDYDQTRLTITQAPAGCVQDVGAGTFTCGSLGGIAPGAFVTVTYAATISGQPNDVAQNTATAQSNETGTVTDQASVTLTAPDLVLTKAVNPVTVPADDTTEVTFTLLYRNAGAVDATNVDINDTLPNELTYVPDSLSDPACQIVGQQITCDNLTETAVDQPISFRATVKSGTAAGTVITNTAAITANEADANPGNNTGNASVTVGVIDLSLDKSVLPATASVGDTVTYTLTFRNTALATIPTAGNIVINDVLPSTLPAGGMTFFACETPLPVGFVSCVSQGQNLTITYNNALPTGSGDVSISYTATVAPGTPNGDLVNNAVITTNPLMTDADALNDTAFATVNVQTPTPDVEMVSKLVDRTAGPAGTVLTYTLNYTNSGTGDANAVTITDTLGGTAAAIFTTLPGGCVLDGTSTVMTCGLGALASGAGNQITYQVTVDPTALQPQTLTNTAVIADPNDSNGNNNQASTQFTVWDFPPDLTMSKVLTSANPALAGTVATYQLTYGNDGPFTTGNATTVVINDVMPNVPNGQLILDTNSIVTSNGENCAASTPAQLSCSLPAVLQGTGGFTITYQATVDPTALDGMTLMNVASVFSNDQPDANNSDNADQVILTAQNRPDLTLSKSGPAGAAAGATVTYTLSYSNIGSAASGLINIVDTLPAEIDSVTVPTNFSNPACSYDGPTHTVNCVGLPALNAAEVAPNITFDATVTPGTPVTTPVTNTAVISTPVPEFTNANNTGVYTFNVTANEPDLALAKNGPVNAVAGATITYTLTYSNQGTQDAVNAVIVDDYDQANVAIVGATLPAGCLDDGNTLTCTIPAIVAGAPSQPLSYQATINPGTLVGTQINNGAVISVGPGQTESNTINNGPMTWTVTVSDTSPDLRLNKTALPTAAPAGTVVTYTLDYDNGGALATGPASGLTITDDYDETNMTIVGATLPAGCSDSGTQLTCLIPGPLAVNAAGQIQYQATINAVPDGTAINNNAGIMAAENDADLLNNSASAQVVVESNPPDLTIVKTSDQQTAKPGATLTYTLAYNNSGLFGTGPASAVTITDDYDQLSLTNIVAPGCVDNGDTLTCAVGALARNASGQFQYTADILGSVAVPFGIYNAASITSAEPDGNAADNNDDNTVTTAALIVDLTIAKDAGGVTQIAAGEQVTYTLTYGNDGAFALANGDNATSVVIEDDYDEVNLTNIVLSDPAFCDVGITTAGRITCNVPAFMAPGTGGLTFSYTADVIAGAAIGTLINNTARITTADQAEAAVIDNQSSVQLSVQPAVSIQKNASALVVGDNTLVTYTLTVTRNTSAGGAMAVILGDTVTGTDVIPGTNGASLNYVPNTGVCVTTNAVCAGVPFPGGTEPQINIANLNLTLNALGSSITYTYQARSDNNGALDGVATNTAQATVVPGGAQTQDSVGVTVTPAIGGGGGQPGGIISSGGGGGYAMITGKMKLTLSQFISLDGVHYIGAESKPQAMVIPERQISRIYVKARIENSGEATATRVILKRKFDGGKSDMVADPIEDLKGARLEKKTGYLVIDKIPAGKSQELTYTLPIHELGESSEFATETLQLLDFKSKLPIQQDGLTYEGKGSQVLFYFVAGKIPSQIAELALIEIEPQEPNAVPGQIVSTLVSVTNLSGKDLTGLTIVYNYDESLVLPVKAPGARDDGTELTWKRAILRPNERAVYQVQAKVFESAPAETELLSAVRLTLSDSENVVTAENSLWILTGDAAAQPVGEPKYQLAQTGPGMTFFFLTFAAALAWFASRGSKTLQHLRYLRLKRLALAAI